MYKRQDFVSAELASAFGEDLCAGSLASSISKQTAYFKSLDKEFMDVETRSHSESVGAAKQHDPFAAMRVELGTAMHSLTHWMQGKPKSHSLVLEAVAYLLDQGLLKVSQTGSPNVKQARALIAVAVWLQKPVSYTHLTLPTILLV